MEFWRKKNTDTRVVFPIQKNDGTFITGAAGLDSEFALYGAHGAGAPSFGDCTHEATEIGTTGLYYLDVSAAELNDDYGSVIQVKSSSSGAITQVLLFHTRPDEVDVVNWKGSAAAAMTGDAYAAVGTAQTMLTDIHGTDLPAVKADTAGILTDTGTTLDALVKDIPTNAELSTALGTADDATLAAIAALDTVVDTVHTDVDAILADTGELQTDWVNGGRLDLILDAASAPSAATVADAIWDEVLSGHAAGGSAGAALTGAGSAGDPWTTPLPGAYGAGTAGNIIGASLTLALKLLRNKVTTDPTTGVMTVYDDNGTTPLYTANVYEDIAGTMPFDGTGANRRDRLA